MPTLLSSLLNVSSSWLGGLSFTVESPAPAAPCAGKTMDNAASGGTRVEPQWVPGTARSADRQRVALARTRITEARARLNPVRRTARVVYAPHDSCRTVITGRMGDVCDMLDHLVAREAATMRAHAGTTTLS